jgi:hypothetical protein
VNGTPKGARGCRAACLLAKAMIPLKNLVASGENPPEYGERNVGKAMQASWEILPAKRLASIRLKPKRGKGGRKSEGVTVPMKGWTTKPPGGKDPCFNHVSQNWLALEIAGNGY